MAQHVQMAHIIAFKFKPRATVLSHLSQDMGDVAGGVLENQIVTVFQEWLFPVVFPVSDPINSRIQGEIHAAHIQGTHFRFHLQRGFQPLVQGHGRAAAGGQVDHRVAALLYDWQERHEMLGAGRRPTIDRVTGMQMQDRCASLCGINRIFRDLFPCNGQIGGHGGRVYGPRNRAGDDNLTHKGASLTLRQRRADPPLSQNRPAIQSGLPELPQPVLR